MDYSPWGRKELDMTEQLSTAQHSTYVLLLLLLLSRFSRVWLLATPWTAGHQAPPSMELSRQEHWSGVPLPSPYILQNDYILLTYVKGFPENSAGKESACNEGDPGSILGLGRSPGEGIDYPLQYSWASLVTQTIKNLLAMWETWVWTLSWEDPLEESTATHSSILAWRIPMVRGSWQDTVRGVAKSQTWLRD